MAGYPTSSDETPLIDLGGWPAGWVLADPETAESISSAAPEAALPESTAQKLGVDVALALPHLPTAASKLDLVLSIMAPTTHGTERAPLRLVAVLDKSGSMQGDKIKLVIETVKFMLQHLTERDALGLIAFDTTVNELAPLTRCSSEGRSHLESVINRVKAGSQTNLSGGLLRGLEMHTETLRNPVTHSGSLQRISFGNKYRRLPEAVEESECRPAPAGCERIHEWCMELHTENSADAVLIGKVVYKLHDTFAETRVEVSEPPFRLTRVGWGIFKLHAELHLCDGRVIPVEHELCFDKDSFRTILLPLRSAPRESSPAQFDVEDDQAVVRSTFLFTDGVANVGIQNSDELCKAVEAMSAGLGSKQCTISTFGFGANHSEDLLRNIAKTGNGVYCFIENADSIGEAFGEALGGLLSVTHQNVRLCLELAPGVALVKARTSYPVLHGPACGENAWQSVSIDIGDLFAEERRDILLELSLPEAASDGPEKFGHFYARAFSVLGTCSETTGSTDLVVERLSDSNTARRRAHPQVERHRNRYVASEALQSARTTARRGDLEEARKILQAASAELADSSIALQGCPLTAALLADLQECLADLRTDYAYTSAGSKKMAYMQMAHERQRTCGGTTTELYCNSIGRDFKSMGSRITSGP